MTDRISKEIAKYWTHFGIFYSSFSNNPIFLIEKKYWGSFENGWITGETVLKYTQKKRQNLVVFTIRGLYKLPFSASWLQSEKSIEVDFLFKPNWSQFKLSGSSSCDLNWLAPRENCQSNFMFTRETDEIIAIQLKSFINEVKQQSFCVSFIGYFTFSIIEYWLPFWKGISK